MQQVEYKLLIERVRSTKIKYSTVLHKTQIFLRRNHSDSIGVPLAASPALNTHYLIPLVQNAKLDSILDSPLEATINVLLPVCLLEVRFLSWVKEGIHAPIKVRVLKMVRMVVINTRLGYSL